MHCTLPHCTAALALTAECQAIPGLGSCVNSITRQQSARERILTPLSGAHERPCCVILSLRAHLVYGLQVNKSFFWVFVSWFFWAHHNVGQICGLLFALVSYSIAIMLCCALPVGPCSQQIAQWKFAPEMYIESTTSKDQRRVWTSIS